MSFFDPFFGAGHGTRRSQSQSNDDDPIVINIETDGEPPHSNAAGGNGTPRSPRITRKPAKPHGNHGRRVAIAVVVAIAVIVALFFAVSSFAADVMWYSQLGFQSVVWTLLGTRVGLWVFYAALMVLVSYIAATLAIRARPDFADGSTIRINGDTIEIGKSVSSRTARRVAVVISLIAGIIFGSKVNANWTEILLMFHNQSFGSVDPQFGLDNGFYVFVLPGLRMLVSAFTLLMFVALVFSVATHVAMGGIRFTMPVHGHGLFAITKRARRQIGIWLVLWMLSWAVSQGLSVFSSLTAQGDRFTGANYTAVNAGIPVTVIMAVLTAVLGVVLCVWLMTTHVFDDAVSRPTANAAAAWREWRVPTIAVASTLVVGILLSTLWPMLLQRFRVNPNAQEMESAYIQRNIDATRAAYGLDAVKTDEYKATTKAQAGALQKDAETTAQIRLLDPQIVSPTFKQLQQMKQYYTFADTLAVDKYDIDGVNQDTVIAAREINLEGNDNRNWVNDHTVYTHGYGIVAAYGNKVTSDGQPQFFEYGIPTQGYLTDTQHYEPRIYFSPEAPEYSIVGAPQGTKSWEFDYPTGSEGATTTFNGNGGPRIGNIFSRLIYSIKFGSDQILFSDRVNADSQILYDRSPKERVAKVAPYLTLDGRVYPAVVDGRVKWIVDGYTTSSNYPYSQKTDLAEATQDSTTISSQTVQGLTDKEVNYMRNSVKATVDAYDGSVDLYTWDDSDPVLKAWQSIFPGQYHPMSEISGDLMAHMRYPEGMFKVQRQLLAKYHVTSASQFFSGEDFWQTPVDPTESKSEQSRDVLQPPYYLTLQTGGSDEPVFSLTSTYIPAGSSTREILTGFLSVDSDAGRTGIGRIPATPLIPAIAGLSTRIAIEHLVQRLVERIGETDLVSEGDEHFLEQRVAGCAGGLHVHRLHVDQATAQRQREQIAAFHLRRAGFEQVELLRHIGVRIEVVLRLPRSRHIGILRQLLQAYRAIIGPSDALGAAGDNADGSGSTANTNRNPELSQALQDAGKAMKDADSAMKKGDWSGYGEAQKRLEEALDKAMALDK